MRGIVVLLVVSAAVLSCHAAAVDQKADDELVQLLNKLQSELRSRALEDVKEDVKKDVKEDAKKEVKDDEEINIVRADESHPQSRQAADPPPSTGSGSAPPATDPRPDIAANVLKLVISLLDDSLKLMTSLDSGSGSGGSGSGKSARDPPFRRPDGSEVNDESENSEDSGEDESGSGSEEDSEDSTDGTDDSQALEDRPVGDKRKVKTARRHSRAAKKDAGENDAAGGQGGEGGSAAAAGGSDSADNSSTPPGSPIVAKMIKTLVELEYNLIGFDLITMYPKGNKSAKPLIGAAKKSSSSSAELAEIMSQLNKLDKRHN